MRDVHQGNARKAIVIGGSASGLIIAALLNRMGWRADIYEKSGVELVGRGAGIVCHPELEDALDECGAGRRDLGVTVTERIAFDRDGVIADYREHPQIVTSWDRLHQMGRSAVPDEFYHLGHELVDIDQSASAVTATFANGARVTADILIGADGIRSAVRKLFAPRVNPDYAGYVIWRGLLDEGEMPPALHDAIFDKFAFFLPARNEVLGYPIPGKQNDLRRGRRRYNWVWYTAASPARLDEMLTDDKGRVHQFGISPTLLRAEIVNDMRREARDVIAGPLLEALAVVSDPFVTPIYDFCSPRFVWDRVVLVGDAAVTARPHIGYGTTKAAGDCVALAHAIAAHDEDVPGGLRAYEDERQPVGKRAYRRSRQLAGWMVPETADTHPDDVAEDGLHTVPAILRHTASNEFFTGREVGRRVERALSPLTS